MRCLIVSIIIDKIEINMINESVHNFRIGEFGVKTIEIDEIRGFIEITYEKQGGRVKKALIPISNVEKCEFIDKEELISEENK